MFLIFCCHWIWISKGFERKYHQKICMILWVLSIGQVHPVTQWPLSSRAIWQCDKCEGRMFPQLWGEEVKPESWAWWPTVPSLWVWLTIGCIWQGIACDWVLAQMSPSSTSTQTDVSTNINININIDLCMICQQCKSHHLTQQNVPWAKIALIALSATMPLRYFGKHEKSHKNRNTELQDRLSVT